RGVRRGGGGGAGRQRGAHRVHADHRRHRAAGGGAQGARPGAERGHPRRAGEEVPRRHVPGALRADHRQAEREHRQEDLAQPGAARLRRVGMSGDLAARLAQRALALCRIPSPIGQEAAIADWVEAWAKERYAPQEILRKSHSFVLGNLQDPRPAVLLVGHLDTVPPHPTDAPPRIEGDRLHGLGASDMKGGVAVMLALAEDLPRSALPVNLLLLLYEREEGPYLESGLGPLFEAAPMLSKAKLGIALEPTDGAIQVGC